MGDFWTFAVGGDQFEIYRKVFELGATTLLVLQRLCPQGKHVARGDVQGETCLYNHFGGATALFAYVNLQVLLCEGKTIENF